MPAYDPLLAPDLDVLPTRAGILPTSAPDRICAGDLPPVWPQLQLGQRHDGRLVRNPGDTSCPAPLEDHGRSVPGAHSLGGVQKALARLVEQGIVLADANPAATLFTFNRDHLAARPVIELAQLASTLVERLECQPKESVAVPRSSSFSACLAG